MWAMKSLPAAWKHAELARYVPETARTVLDCTVDATFARLLAGRDCRLHGVAFDGDAPACPGYGAVHAADLDNPALPLEAASVDCVVCDDWTACARDPMPLLRELTRVLSPGGTAVFTFPNLQYHRNIAGLAQGQWRTDTTQALRRAHLRFFTAHEAAALLGRAGLTDPACQVLAGDRPEDAPLDPDRCIVHGRVSIGPIAPEEYPLFLAQQYLLLAKRPPAG